MPSALSNAAFSRQTLLFFQRQEPATVPWFVGATTSIRNVFTGRVEMLLRTEGFGRVTKRFLGQAQRGCGARRRSN